MLCRYSTVVCRTGWWGQVQLSMAMASVAPSGTLVANQVFFNAVLCNLTMGSCRVVTQDIGLNYPDEINDLPSVAGHLKQIIDDFSLRTVLPHIQIEGRVHVHGDGLDVLAGILSIHFK